MNTVKTNGKIMERNLNGKKFLEVNGIGKEMELRPPELLMDWIGKEEKWEDHVYYEDNFIFADFLITLGAVLSNGASRQKLVKIWDEDAVEDFKIANIAQMTLIKPLNHEKMRKQRVKYNKKEVSRFLKSGHSMKEAEQQFNLSHSTVYRINKEIEEEKQSRESHTHSQGIPGESVFIAKATADKIENKIKEKDNMINQLQEKINEIENIPTIIEQATPQVPNGEDLYKWENPQAQEIVNMFLDGKKSGEIEKIYPEYMVKTISSYLKLSSDDRRKINKILSESNKLTELSKKYGLPHSFLNYYKRAFNLKNGKKASGNDRKIIKEEIKYSTWKLVWDDPTAQKLVVRYLSGETPKGLAKEFNPQMLKNIVSFLRCDDDLLKTIKKHFDDGLAQKKIADLLGKKECYINYIHRAFVLKDKSFAEKSPHRGMNGLTKLRSLEI